MKARPYKATPVPLTAGKGTNDTISQAQLVALIAARSPRDAADDEATVRNRTLARVSRDVKLGKLVRRKDGFRIGDVAAWASSRWPDRYNDLPKDEVVGHAALQIAPITLRAVGYVLPASIEGAVQELIKLHDTIDALRTELNGERAKVRELEPDAKKWRDWMMKKRRKGGSSNRLIRFS